MIVVRTIPVVVGGYDRIETRADIHPGALEAAEDRPMVTVLMVIILIVGAHLVIDPGQNARVARVAD